MNPMGAPVGIRSAQSILSKATQSHLSHFHVAGMESLSEFYEPSIKDAMDSKYNTENTSVKFTIKCRMNEQSYGEIRRHLVGKKLIWFVKMISSTTNADLPPDEDIWYDILEIEKSQGFILRLYIDYRKMVKHGLTLQSIGSTCFRRDVWQTSPDFMGMIDINVDQDNISSYLAKMEQYVCGTPRIASCNITPTDETEVDVVTAGSDILTVSRIPGIDKKTLTSNDVTDVATHFGIEAAAYALRKIIDSQVVSDFMTRTGHVLPFVSSSIEVSKKGVLTAMAFERPRNHIKNALRSSALDKHASIYADIMVGRNPSSGSLVF